MPDGIQFQNMHHKSMFSELNANEVGHDDDDSCASNNNQKDKAKRKEDVKLISDMNIDDDKLEDIDNMGKEDELHLKNKIANEENQSNYFGAD